jgi:hypothetical protein
VRTSCAGPDGTRVGRHIVAEKPNTSLLKFDSSQFFLYSGRDVLTKVVFLFRKEN